MPTLFANTTYPSESTLTSDESRIVSEIRNLIGDFEQVDYDFYGNVDFESRVYASGTTYRFSEDVKAWPLKVAVSGTDFTSESNPTVNNYQWLVFGSAALSEPTFTMFFKTFRFSDSEILAAYDQSLVLLTQRSLPDDELTEGLRALQAAITLLEAELGKNADNYIQIQDGKTIFNNTGGGRIAQGRLAELRKEFEKAMFDIRQHVSLQLVPIRVE